MKACKRCGASGEVMEDMPDYCSFQCQEGKDMDENQQLGNIRRLVTEVQRADRIGGALGRGLKGDYALELANAVAELDEHLSDNGMPPLAWLPPEAVKGGTAGTGQGTKKG